MSNPPAAVKKLFENGGDGLFGSAVRFEDFFHFGRIRGACNGLISGDEAPEIGVGDTVVHRLHAEFSAGFDDVGDFVDAVFADAVSDSRGAEEDFGAGDHAGLVNSAEQRLRDDGLEGIGEHCANLVLLARGIDIDDTLDGLSGVDSVQC